METINHLQKEIASKLIDEMEKGGFGDAGSHALLLFLHDVVTADPRLTLHDIANGVRDAFEEIVDEAIAQAFEMLETGGE